MLSGAVGEHPPNVLPDQVTFDVHPRAGFEHSEVGMLPRVGDHGDLTDVVVRDRVDRKTHTVEGDRSMEDGRRCHIGGDSEVEETILPFVLDTDQITHCVDVTLNEVSIQASS